MSAKPDEEKTGDKRASMPRRKILNLTGQEAGLLDLLHSDTFDFGDQRVTKAVLRRARIVEDFLYDDKSIAEIAQSGNIPRQSVYAILNRFQSFGVDGLFDGKRSGRPRDKVTPGFQVRLLDALTEMQAEPKIKRGVRTLARELGVSPTTVFRAIQCDARLMRIYRALNPKERKEITKPVVESPEVVALRKRFQAMKAKKKRNNKRREKRREKRPKNPLRDHVSG